MIGFEITAVYVCVYAKERPQWNEIYNVHSLEGDSAQRLSHHYHQWTDEIKAVHLLSQSNDQEKRIIRQRIEQIYLPVNHIFVLFELIIRINTVHMIGSWWRFIDRSKKTL